MSAFAIAINSAFTFQLFKFLVLSLGCH